MVVTSRGPSLWKKNIICLIIIVCSSKFTYSSENWGRHWAILNDALMIAQLKNSHQGAILRWAILRWAILRWAILRWAILGVIISGRITESHIAYITLRRRDHFHRLTRVGEQRNVQQSECTEKRAVFVNGSDSPACAGSMCVTQSQNLLIFCDVVGFGTFLRVTQCGHHSGEFSFTATAAKLPPSPQEPFCGEPRSFWPIFIDQVSVSKKHSQKCVIYFWHSVNFLFWISGLATKLKLW